MKKTAVFLGTDYRNSNSYRLCRHFKGSRPSDPAGLFRLRRKQ